MKKTQYLILLCMLILVVACSNSSIKAEPKAPDPFPVELSSRLSVFDVNVKEQSTTLKLLMTVSRNYEYHDNLKLNYTVFKTIDNTQEELINKKLLDNAVDLYVKKSITDEIKLIEFSKYLIRIESSYNSYGQSVSYLVDFDKNGVSILQLEK
ncbi:hypothetical protein ACFP56_10905 [Paenibacillus septentrionalis]|uniref:DUF5067 domain-containing protein n=1 Tax=Paenibacillus septentrionalis TaxID=429342 RepID=A0ABW1V2Y4_9BACL